MSAALLVVDVQNEVVAGIDSVAVTIATIVELVQRARSSDRLVVWVQHDDPQDLPVGSDGWQIVPQLRPEPGELIVRKQHRSAFAGTGLAEKLRRAAVDEIVLTGVQSAFCVDLAGKHALAEGFSVTLVSDGHCNGAMATDAGELTDAQVRALVNRTWSSLRHPGLRVAVTPAAAVAW